MKYTDVAVQDLKRYSYLKNSLSNISARTEMLEDSYISIKGIDTSREPTCSGGSKQEDYRINNIVERKRLDDVFKINYKLVKLIEKGLTSLSKDERLVLEYFFINRPKNYLDRIMEKLNLEKSQVYNLKDKALYKFTISMYGIAEY